MYRVLLAFLLLRRTRYIGPYRHFYVFKKQRVVKIPLPVRVCYDMYSSDI